VEDRRACEITFPRLNGYRYELEREELNHVFDKDSQFVLSTEQIPSFTENAPIVGEMSIHTLEELKAKREQEVAFLISKLVLEKYFRTDDGEAKPWLFPQVLSISKLWLEECVVRKDNTFNQMLLLLQLAHNAADKIYRSIVKGEKGAKTLKPILRPYDTLGSTRYLDFDTIRATYLTRPDKCHISHVVCDTGSWEQKMAQTLEEMPEVLCYAKNHHLGFEIPYTINGEQHNYVPDFIAKLIDGKGPEDPLNLIIEVTGEQDAEKAVKVETARTLWIPAVNNHGGFGRWAFVEIPDPWNAMNEIRANILS
jgi:type III restriction enzyme